MLQQKYQELEKYIDESRKTSASLIADTRDNLEGLAEAQKSFEQHHTNLRQQLSEEIKQAQEHTEKHFKSLESDLSSKSEELRYSVLKGLADLDNAIEQLKVKIASLETKIEKRFEDVKNQFSSLETVQQSLQAKINNIESSSIKLGGETRQSLEMFNQEVKSLRVAMSQHDKTSSDLQKNYSKTHEKLAWLTFVTFITLPAAILFLFLFGRNVLHAINNQAPSAPANTPAQVSPSISP